MTDAPPRPAAGPGTGSGRAVAPARVDGVELIGEMRGSGYRVPPALARRPDGQTVQLTPLLYATLSVLDGTRSYAEVAASVAAATGKPVSEDNARELVDRLRPLGLATREDGSEPELRRSNPLLALRFKIAVTDEHTTRRLTAPFVVLFSTVVVVPVLLAFGWVTWWVLFDRGLAAATHDAFARPGLLLAVLAVTVLSAGFHEFGHAAAARRGGAVPGVMGAGLYLVWPAFYTDVTDSYRLGRGGRLRTDVGGLYFNAIVAVLTVAVWWFTDSDAILLLVAAQVLQMIRQLLPFVRFDGYHILADLTGVPDLFQRIGPTLKGLVPWVATPAEARALKPWARAVVTVWVLTVVPVLLFTVLTMVLTLPRVVGTALASAGAQRDALSVAFADGDPVGVLARALAIVVVALPIAAFGYILVRLVRQVGLATWRRTRDRPLRRAAALLLATALVAGVAWAWWPSADRYRPVLPYEGGTVSDVVGLAAETTGLARAATGAGVGSQGAGTVAWPADTALPTREEPQLALVLVPTGDRAAADGGDAATLGDSGSTAATAPHPWIFPFDEPLAPDQGDTQALAVNTSDGTATYDVAFALVWADGDEPADNSNEAYAFASCDGCAAVAVAFQVVLVVGEADVAVPQNTSVALNYDCTSCLTYALAVQLFVTLDAPLTDEEMAALAAVWNDVLDFGADIADVPLDEIQSRLSDFEEQILAAIGAEQAQLPAPGTTTSPSPTATGSPSEEPAGTTTPSSSATPTASPSASPTSSATSSTSPSASSSTSPTASATTSPSPSATQSASPSPSGTSASAAASSSPSASP